MALAIDPFDVDFATSPPDPLSTRPWRGGANGERVAMSLPPIALCLPTLFGPATFAVSPSRRSAPSGGEGEGQ